MLRMVIASLLLGIASTIAAAWACAAWPSNGGFVEYIHFADAPQSANWRWPIEVYELRRPGLWIRSWQAANPGDSLIPLEFSYTSVARQHNGMLGKNPIVPFPAGVMAPVPGVNGKFNGYERAAGWPSMCCWCETPVSRSAAGSVVACHGGFLVTNPSLTTRDLGQVRVLPFRPIWSGLAANVALYTFAWMTLLMFLPAIRRALRRRRGLCPSCRYSLVGLPPAAPCPECGQPAP